MLIVAARTKSYTHSAVMASSRSGLAVRIQAAALTVARAGGVIAWLLARRHGVRLGGRAEQVHQAGQRREQDTAPLRELDACVLPAPGSGKGARQRQEKGDDH